MRFADLPRPRSGREPQNILRVLQRQAPIPGSIAGTPKSPFAKMPVGRLGAIVPCGAFDIRTQCNKRSPYDIRIKRRTGDGAAWHDVRVEIPGAVGYISSHPVGRAEQPVPAQPAPNNSGQNKRREH